MGLARSCGSAPTPPGAGGFASVTPITIVSGARWCAGLPRASWPPATTGFASAPTRSRLPEGESPRLTARFADGIAGVGPDLLVVARIFKAVASQGEPPKAEGEAIAIVPLQPVPGQPRTFAAISAGARGRPLPGAPRSGTTGRRFEGHEHGRHLRPRWKSHRARLPSSSNWPPHAIPSIAWPAATGGRVFTAAEADQLPGFLRSRTIVKTRTEETTLWDRPWALGLFFGILTFEWVLRKRVGLP